MKYFSVCSGIECFSVAVKGLDYEPVAFAEIENFPSAVLNYHYPDVPNIGDFTDSAQWPKKFDLLVGGTPCQSFSIAGLRKGLNDKRGNLAYAYCRILRDKQPKYFIWENVPGCQSTRAGRDFTKIIQAFTESGYCCAWRILDAQYFGVPQRRRRVFVVGSLGNERAGKILFEREGLRGNIEKGEEARKETAGEVQNYIMSSGQANAEVIADISPTLNCLHEAPIIFGTIDAHYTKIGHQNDKESSYVYEDGYIRRLTPLECERLQGLPDNYTRIPYNGKPVEKCPDAPRYKAIGNGMAVPVMRWIAKRILEQGVE